MKNKVVIVTGGTSGIGLSCAEKFGLEGAHVVITGRDKMKLDEAVEFLKLKNISVLGVLSDVSIFEDCEKVVNATIEKFQRIDVLINNAGISMRSLFKDIDLGAFKKLIDINFWGTVYMTKIALPFIIKTKGSIIGISSIGGKKGLPGRTAYSSSKFGMEGFLQTIRIELIPDDVHVLVVSPGFVNTNIRNVALTSDGSSQGESPLDEAKLMTPEEVASKIYYATKKRKRDLVLSTQGKLLVFINKFFPGFADKQVFAHFAKEKDSPLKKN